MAALNKVFILGHLGKDPETRYTTGGDAVTNLRVATSEKFTDRAGQKQEKTEWHSIVLFGRPAEIAGEYLKKGSLAMFEGKLQTRKWEKDGVERYTTEIVAHSMQLLDRRPAGDDGDEPRTGSSAGEYQGAKDGARAPQERAPERAKNVDDFDDDIPF